MTSCADLFSSISTVKIPYSNNVQSNIITTQSAISEGYFFWDILTYISYSTN